MKVKKHILKLQKSKDQEISHYNPSFSKEQSTGNQFITKNLFCYLNQNLANHSRIG